MPPPSQGTLYTDPVSITGLMGSVGLRLRLDDDGTSTGSITGATATSPIVITSAGHGRSTGDLVQIAGVLGNSYANGTWFVTVLDADHFSVPIAAAGTYTSGGTWIAVTQPEAGFLVNACNVATSKVNRFCQPLYDAVDLANSWSVWNWATIIAAHWVYCRRGNPAVGSLLNLYIESLDEMQAVRNQEMPIEDIGYRNSCMPVWSNLRVDQRWTIKKMRVETVLSDRTNPNYPQKQDMGAAVVGPVERDRW